MVKVFRFLFSLDAPQDISGTVLFILALLEEVPWYGETEVNMFGFIGLGLLFVLLGLAKAAHRLNIGPKRLQRFAIEKHTLF
jgi:hypothetical protein